LKKTNGITEGGSDHAAKRGSDIGSRIDSSWSHWVLIDGKTRYVKCKYCDKVLTRGIYRLKLHLVGTSKDVGACITILEC